MDYGAPPPRYTSASSKRSAWKRPKPKVYECNERDAMRFYETSYNEYKRNKDDAEDRRRTEMNRDLLNDHPLSWRSASLSRERSRPAREEEKPKRDPFKREGSFSALSSSESRSEGQTRLNSQSATEVDDNFQARLDRLKKLREELGLPSQNGTAESSSSSLSKSSAKEATESGFKSSFSSSSESKYGSTKKSAVAVEEDDEVPSYRSRRAKATPVKDDETPPRENKWTKYTSYREKREEDPEPEVADPDEYTYKAKSRTSGWRAKLADDLSKCELYDNIEKDKSPFSLKKNDYSFKSSGNSDVNGDSSFSARSAYKSDFSNDVGGSSSSKSFASASSSSYKSKAVDMSTDYDDDDSNIASLCKKLPSSAEILERITTSMSDKSKWKRKLPTRIYDYNFKVSEGYYAPQTEFIETRPLHRTKVTPPEHASYAERFSERPWYGGVKGLPYPESEAAMYKPIVRPRSASMSRLSTPIRTFEDDDEPISSRLSRGRSRLGSVSRLDDDDLYTQNDLQELDIKDELRKINEQLHSAKMKPGLPVCPRSYVDTPRITQSEWRRRNKFVPLNDAPSLENVIARPPLPPSSSTIKKSSINIETKVESKPPLSLRTRRASVGSVAFDDDDEDNDISSTIMRKSRSRNISFSDSMDMPPRPPSTNRLIEDNQRKHFNAQQMADARRLQASEELSDYINRKVTKLSSMSSAPLREVDVPHKTAYSRRIRASSMDPYQSSYNAESTEGHPRNFCWGYCK